MPAQVGFLLFKASCNCSTDGLGVKETMASGKPSGNSLPSAGMYILVGVLSRASISTSASGSSVCGSSSVVCITSGSGSIVLSGSYVSSRVAFPCFFYGSLQ